MQSRKLWSALEIPMADSLSSQEQPDSLATSRDL